MNRTRIMNNRPLERLIVSTPHAQIPFENIYSFTPGVDQQGGGNVDRQVERFHETEAGKVA